MSSATQRHLLVMRHATAGLAHGMAPDFERPLTEQGVSEAIRVGAYIAQWRQKQPLAVVCSQALRARQTLEAVLRAGVKTSSLTYEATFYQGNVEQVLESLWTTTNEASALLIIGHNPTWSELVTYLAASMASLSPAHAVLLSRTTPSWEVGLSTPGWSIEQKIQP